MVVLADLLDMRVDTLERSIPIIMLETFDQSVTGDEQANFGLNREHYDVHEELRKAIAHLYETFGVYKSAMGALGVSWQRLKISTTTTTTVVNDTIATASQTPIAFDWQDARRISKIVLSPGVGVRDYGLIFDVNLSDKDTYDGVCFGADTNKLQRVGWDGATWVGKAWDEDWTIDLIQIAVGSLPELP